LDIRQVGMILAFVSLIDNRNVSDESILAWYELIKECDFDDAKGAVINHFRTSTEYIRPAHIISGARMLKMERRKELYGND
jgi:hypothetical protein